MFQKTKLNCIGRKASLPSQFLTPFAEAFTDFLWVLLEIL